MALKHNTSSETVISESTPAGPKSDKPIKREASETIKGPLLAILVAIPLIISGTATAAEWKIGQAAWTNPEPACISPDLLEEALDAHKTSNFLWFSNHKGRCVVLKNDLRAEVFEVLRDRSGIYALGVKVRENRDTPWVRLYTMPNGIWPCTPGFC